jgi:Protein of unknown function (DUF3375)
MSLDFDTLQTLRERHPAWKLLRYENAPLVGSFLHRRFVQPNQRVIAQSDLVEALEDDLFSLRQRYKDFGSNRSANDYLTDWSSNDRGWLRKFYRDGSDEPHFDLTPGTEKAISWLTSLTDRTFVGTESRLLTLFEILQQLAEGTQTDPAVRMAELLKRREEIEAEIQRVERGEIDTLDDRSVKERFQQFVALARELLSDFREVEHNFRSLDRRVRERIALFEGNKGELVGEILGERDEISDSEEGRSFRAFFEFLMSAQRQEVMSERLDAVLQLSPVQELLPDRRIRRIHYDWLEAGEHTQRTVALLSSQLRRFLDDQAWIENRRIMTILHDIEAGALAVRDDPPIGSFFEIEQTWADITLPMERPLFTPKDLIALKDVNLKSLDNENDDDIDVAGLFKRNIVDVEVLAQRITDRLAENADGNRQVTLAELCIDYPVHQGLAEIVAYLHLASERFRSTVDENEIDTIAWVTDDERDISDRGDSDKADPNDVEDFMEQSTADVKGETARTEPPANQAKQGTRTVKLARVIFVA